MLGFIAPTDQDWFDFLSAEKGLDEVNFWQPGGERGFHAVPPGAPFFFKLKSPINKIGGFGYLSRTQILPVWLAWDTFGRGNGVTDLAQMRARIAKYRKRFSAAAGPEPKIGCLMIIEPTFFREEDWVPQPKDWKPNIVSGTSYDLSQGEGKRVFEDCLARANTLQRGGGNLITAVPAPRYGEPTTYLPRLGQGSFRLAVMAAYRSACAVTTEHSLPALEAAHIKPYGEGGEHRVSNGLLLRSDIHRLFDKGYVTVTPDLKFLVGRKLKEDFENGKSYYGLNGQELNHPASAEERPDRLMLRWHNEARFRG